MCACIVLTNSTLTASGERDEEEKVTPSECGLSAVAIETIMTKIVLSMPTPFFDLFEVYDLSVCLRKEFASSLTIMIESCWGHRRMDEISEEMKKERNGTRVERIALEKFVV